MSNNLTPVLAVSWQQGKDKNNRKRYNAFDRELSRFGAEETAKKMYDRLKKKFGVPYVAQFFYNDFKFARWYNDELQYINPIKK